MIAAEFEPAQMSTRRGATRAPVSLDARVARDEDAGGIGRALCKVADLTMRGARVHTYSLLRKGATIWLTLPLIGPVAADVMWASDFEAGCQFRRPLAPDQFRTLLAQA